MNSMTSIWFRAVSLMAAGALLGAGSNLFGPQRIPWIRGQQAEATAGLEKGDVSTEAVRLFSSKKVQFPVTILDSRRKEDYLKGHIPTALSLDVRQFDGLFPEVKSRLIEGLPIVIYCNGGHCEDSHNLRERLRALEMEPLIYAGGWEAWTTAGMPVEVGEAQ